MRRRTIFAAGAIVVIVTALCISAVTVLRAQAAGQSDAIVPHRIAAHPVLKPAGKPQDAIFGCQTDRGPTVIRCYSPQQVRHAYGVDQLIQHGDTGKGRTIAIIDAFQNPGMVDDLHTFDTTFGLPDPVFQQVAPDGLTPFDPTDGNQVGWASEIALDVQYAHAMAPDAKIVLVLAKTNADTDLLSATKYAVDHNLGDVISQSFGGNENCEDRKLVNKEHQIFMNATRKGITLVSSTGDQGAAQLTCDGNSWTQVTQTPAADPLVLTVGATELHAAPDIRCTDANGTIIPCPTPAKPTPGTYQSEIVLNQTNTPVNLGLAGNFASGGGFSDLYHRPQYQQGIQTQRPHSRGVPDVAFTGGINFGVLASFEVGGGFFVFGGTSVGAPDWAGLIALGDQLAGRRLGFVNAGLYRLARSPLYPVLFHDVTVGNNSVTEPDANGNLVNVAGFSAGPKWDATTGLGSPKANVLIPALVGVVLFSDGNDAVADAGS